MDKYEGKIGHMYLDSKGHETVGAGHLITNVMEAQKLSFRDVKNMPAKAADIKADFDAVKKQPKNRVASFYKKHTKLVLPATEIDKLTNKHIDSFGKELKLVYSGFYQFPSSVKLALFDLIFNVGMTDLKNKWPNFNIAINKAKDWQKVADDSNRKAPIAAERNKYVKDLLKKLRRMLHQRRLKCRKSTWFVSFH